MSVHILVRAALLPWREAGSREGGGRGGEFLLSRRRGEEGGSEELIDWPEIFCFMLERVVERSGECSRDICDPQSLTRLEVFKKGDKVKMEHFG